MTTNQTAQASRNTWLWLGLLLAVAVALAVWLMPRPTTGTSEAATAAQNDEPAIAAAPEAPKTAEPAPTVEAKPEPEAKPAEPAAPAPAAAKDSDMFAEPMPDFMVDLHARVLDKKWLSARQQKQLYEYGQEHKNDARPQLILAWDAKNREWDGIASDMYRIAYKADKRAKDDPNMLKDLMFVAGAHTEGTVEFKDTAELIHNAYGLDALPNIDSELAIAKQRGEQTRADRLTKLREYIRSR